jgi:translin
LLLKRDLETIQRDLSTFDQIREQVFTISRSAVRLAGTSILEIHRGDLKTAATTIKEAWKVLEHIEEVAKTHAELLTSPSVTVAYQEFVEASSLFEFVEKGKVPSLKETGASYRSYILGLLDVIGEFRRMALNSLRKGEVATAEKLLDLMEGVYEDLQTLEHTSIIPTFRVKMDVARKIIESTRGDVVTEVRRYSLEQALDRVGKKLSSRTHAQSNQ